MLTQSVRIASANEWIILPINVEKLCNIFSSSFIFFEARYCYIQYSHSYRMSLLFFWTIHTHALTLVESSYCFTADGLCRRRHNDGRLFVVLLQCKYHQTPAIAHICVTTCKFLASDPILGTNTIERHCIYLLLSTDKTISSLCTKVSLSEWCDLRKMIIDLELCNDSFLRHHSPHIHIASPPYCPYILSAWWWRWM